MKLFKTLTLSLFAFSTCFATDDLSSTTNKLSFPKTSGMRERPELLGNLKSQMMAIITPLAEENDRLRRELRQPYVPSYKPQNLSSFPALQKESLGREVDFVHEVFADLTQRMLTIISNLVLENAELKELLGQNNKVAFLGSSNNVKTDRPYSSLSYEELVNAEAASKKETKKLRKEAKILKKQYKRLKEDSRKKEEKLDEVFAALLPVLQKGGIESINYMKEIFTQSPDAAKYLFNVIFKESKPIKTDREPLNHIPYLDNILFSFLDALHLSQNVAEQLDPITQENIGDIYVWAVSLADHIPTEEERRKTYIEEGTNYLFLSVKQGNKASQTKLFDVLSSMGHILAEERRKTYIEEAIKYLFLSVKQGNKASQTILLDAVIKFKAQDILSPYIQFFEADDKQAMNFLLELCFEEASQFKSYLIFEMSKSILNQFLKCIDSNQKFGIEHMFWDMKRSTWKNTWRLLKEDFERANCKTIIKTLSENLSSQYSTVKRVKQDAIIEILEAAQKILDNPPRGVNLDGLAFMSDVTSKLTQALEEPLDPQVDPLNIFVNQKPYQWIWQYFQETDVF